ncbi:uncharacterized protein DDB_G0290685-like [Tigriopus californicus]|uniref:uncharacterized protein DDB_G0290685-like n=1 Tax=Tigriopus californicus TaxID=6832 RepID=UPI0027DA9210|nr:uncharacterized protein DDB_G0290685-like [Tigriopus californicus]
MDKRQFSDPNPFEDAIKESNLTTINTDELSSTISDDAIDALMQALDNAAQGIEDAQVFSDDAFTTPAPSEETTTEAFFIPIDGDFLEPSETTISPDYVVQVEDYEDYDSPVSLSDRVVDTKEYNMTSYLTGLDTKIIFYLTAGGATLLDCSVYVQDNDLFSYENGTVLEVRYLPALYLVDGREDCGSLVEETGTTIFVRFIGAIQKSGNATVDISDTLNFSELEGRCVVIMLLEVTASGNVVTGGVDSGNSLPSTPNTDGDSLENAQNQEDEDVVQDLDNEDANTDIGSNLPAVDPEDPLAGFHPDSPSDILDANNEDSSSNFPPDLGEIAQPDSDPIQNMEGVEDMNAVTNPSVEQHPSLETDSMGNQDGSSINDQAMNDNADMFGNNNGNQNMPGENGQMGNLDGDPGTFEDNNSHGNNDGEGQGAVLGNNNGQDMLDDNNSDGDSSNGVNPDNGLDMFGNIDNPNMLQNNNNNPEVDPEMFGNNDNQGMFGDDSNNQGENQNMVGDNNQGDNPDNEQMMFGDNGNEDGFSNNQGGSNDHDSETMFGNNDNQSGYVWK